AVIQGSTAAQDSLLPEAWPNILEYEMNGHGAPVKVYDCGIDGLSFYRAMNNIGSSYMFGNNTAVQQCISYNPQIVIVSLGDNDTIPNVDGRTLSQIESDAVSL